MLTFMLNIGLVSTVAAKSGDPLVAVDALIEAAKVECGERSAADTVTGLDTRVELERCDVWVDERRGSFTVRSIVPAATAAEAPNAAALAGFEDEGRRLANAYGVVEAEVGRVVARATAVQALGEDGKLGAVAYDRVKVWVFRQVEGIELPGHRLVITWSPEGDFKGVAAHWPAVSSETFLDGAWTDEREALDVVARSGLPAWSARAAWLAGPVEDGWVTQLTRSIEVRTGNAPGSGEVGKNSARYVVDGQLYDARRDE